MQVRLLLGPAGSGKTFRCLAEIREALSAAPEGPPLLLIAPKQTTYQLERQLLANGSIRGYTRLHILSFERLARQVFEMLNRPAPDLLDEEGRLMVLRGLLAKKKNELKLFRASARLTGFARQLSQVLHEFQHSRLTPKSLNEIAARIEGSEGLASKLQDLATLFQHYLDWIAAHGLQDADCLLDVAAKALTAHVEHSASSFHMAGVWVDGFAEFSEQELELLAALLPYCDRATVTLCLDRKPTEKVSWLSTWSVTQRTFEYCKARFEDLPLATVSVELLPRRPEQNRFSVSPALQHLEGVWAEPRPRTPVAAPQRPGGGGRDSLRLIVCANPEGEATLAAREILRFARNGGRYRDVAVLVRNLEGYHQSLQRVFSKYEIPSFMDRRESVAQHPLAELTRNALRTVVMGWQHEDWFSALKTGLTPADDHDIDELENEALARGWTGGAWHEPLRIHDGGAPPEQRENLKALEARLERIRRKVVPPFEHLALAIAAKQNQPTGPLLAAALRELWNSLGVEQRLRQWAEGEAAGYDSQIPAAVHATVWEQMNAWLDNVEMAFPDEPLSLRNWLPILEAGLSNLTVGVIPPALDQVLIGPIDRSRNPDIKLALVLGLNEGVFPAPPQTAVLLTEMDRAELAHRNVVLSTDARRHLGRERYYAYIAFTRSRQNLILTCSLQDTAGATLNPSPFMAQVQRLFPDLELENAPAASDWQESQHATELINPILSQIFAGRSSRREEALTSRAPGQEEKLEPPHVGCYASLTPPSTWANIKRLPAVAAALERLRHFEPPPEQERLDTQLAARLYGPVLRTSVSRMEQFAACPFKFFVHSGLRAEERQLFELDVKEQGSFQHDVLALFHDQLRRENKRWLDISPQDARERIGRIAASLMAGYRDGLLQASQQTRFLARTLTESLQDFIEVVVGWMGSQYQFEPEQVELPFGSDSSAPAWDIDLGDTHHLALQGRIDRVDLWRRPSQDEALCVVVDYKSSQKQLDSVLMAHGLQLQLLAYLNVLRRWPNPRELFRAGSLIPAGVFYVNLRGKYERKPNRREALADPAQSKMLAYRHSGRFDAAALPHLDSRPDAREGTQFIYRLNQDGSLHKGRSEGLEAPQFLFLLDSIEASLKEMGRRIYLGAAEVDPYQKGSAVACDQCAYRAICRIDPWTHSYRVLTKCPPVS